MIWLPSYHSFSISKCSKLRKKCNTLLITILVALVATKVQAQLGINPMQIIGLIPCSLNGTVNPFGPLANPFANATVQLSCGGNVRASTTTSQSGGFNISVNPLQVTLNQLLSSCALRVPTPLSTCNAALPSTGSLTSNIEVVIVPQNITVIPGAGANFTLFAPTEFFYIQA